MAEVGVQGGNSSGPSPIETITSTGHNQRAVATIAPRDGSDTDQIATLIAALSSVGGTVSISGSVAVTGTFFQATQPISAAALPLPSGAAIAAKQPALGTPGTASADVLTVQGVASMTALKTDGSGVTQPVSAASLPLPSGAATAAGLTTINTTLGSPFQSGGSIGNASFGISGTLPAFAATPAVKIDQTTPGTTNGVFVNNTSLAVTGTFFQATQPVSLASPATTTPAHVTPAAGTAAQIVTGGTAVTVVTGPVNGGYILNPPNAAAQGVALENAYVDPVGTPGSTDANAHGTTTLLPPGVSYPIPPLANGAVIKANAATSGHNLTVVVWAILALMLSPALPAWAQTSGNSADAVTAQGTGLGQEQSYPYLFNGTTFDRWYGDKTNGAFVNVKSSILPTGAATSALQTTGNTALTTINTTLGTPMQQTGGSVTANAGTNLNTSLLALESGGNLATLAGGVSASVYQVNTKQINGVTPLMGAGNTGTGSPRITIATDQAALASAGQVATGAAPPAGVQYIGANASGATGGHVAGLITCDSHVFKHITTATDTLAVQGVASQTVYICGYSSRAAGTATWFLENTASTNANCSSSNTQITGLASEVANSGMVVNSPFWNGLKNTSGNGLCINSTGTGGVDVDINYTQF